MYLEISSVTTPSILDICDGTFTITPTPFTPEITVTAPKGGESYVLGATVPITWTKSGATGSDVQIIAHGTGQNPTLSASTPNDGAYDWVIPQGQSTGKYYTIVVRFVGFPTVFDVSNAAFTISGATPVTRPPSSPGRPRATWARL
jgi:hypothetical protein